VFDALFVDGKDMRHKPLLERKEILKGLLPPASDLIMLPSQRSINVVSDNAGPLPLGVHEKFGSQSEVVQLIWRVIDLQQKRLLVGGTG